MEKIEFKGLTEAYKDYAERIKSATERITALERKLNIRRINLNFSVQRKKYYDEQKKLGIDVAEILYNDLQDEQKKYKEEIEKISSELRKEQLMLEPIKQGLDKYIEQVTSDPEVLEYINSELEKGYKKSKEGAEEKKSKAEKKKEILDQIKNSPNAQKEIGNLIEIAQEVSNIRNEMAGKNENSDEYKGLQEQLTNKEKEVQDKKETITTAICGFEEDNKDIVKEMLDNLVMNNKKDKDGKLNIEETLNANIALENGNIESANKDIKFNELAIQEITGRTPQQVGTSNPEKEGPEQTGAPKKQNLFRRIGNKIKMLFSKENPEALPEGEPQQQGQQPAQQTAQQPEQQQEESEFIKGLKENPMVNEIIANRRAEIDKKVKESQQPAQQQENDELGR